MDKSPAPALSTGLEIIELIADNGELGFNEISQLKEINVSTLNRILKVLLSKSYLMKNKKGRYILGSRLFTLSKSNSIWNVLLRNASSVLHEISKKFKVTSLIFGFTDESIIALDKVIHRDSIAMQPIGCISKQFLDRPWGFVYMANVSDNKKKNIYSLVNNDNEINKILFDEDITDFIEFAKKNGYSDDFGKIDAHVRRLAVPIYGVNSEVIAALAVGAVNNSLLTEEMVMEIIAYLKEKSRELSLLI